eukprot:12702385-Heterocapsa_arctica.AAC.1
MIVVVHVCRQKVRGEEVFALGQLHSPAAAVPVRLVGALDCTLKGRLDLAQRPSVFEQLMDFG